MQPVRAGIIGCGTISGIYLQNGRVFDGYEIVACADILVERAKARAAEHNIPKACSVEELLADPDIELVINLTIPRAHAAVGLAALRAGKSVYHEKPLAVTRADGKALLDLAAEKRLLVGCAPDTFLGGGLQTCRALIDDGAIGQPVAATAFFMSHGPERWHPDPDFYYQPGAGPLFDMGPYYLTALIALLGPVRSVVSGARASFRERTVGSGPKEGETIQVDTPTHVTGVVQFASGALATLITSFDVWHSHLPRIEIHGSEGALSVPDPNTFRGPVLLRRAGDDDWREMPIGHGYTENSRGIGVADMGHALRHNRPHRASGQLAYHVLDTMESLLESARLRRFVRVNSSCERPAPLPPGLEDGHLDA